MSIGRFYAGIGALIWDPVDDKYLVLRRVATKEFAAGAWECVTGRVDQGEGFEDALHREVREELGVAIRPLFMIGTTHFYRGPARPEYELIGVVYCCTIIPDPDGAMPELTISHEHDDCRWLSADQIRELLSSDDQAEQWLVRVIDRTERTRAQLPTSLVEYHQLHGFELDL